MAALHFDANNFNSEVLQSEIPVLVDFWAPWCGPCRMIGPIIEELSDELAGKVKVGKVNVDENPNLAMEYGVMSIPTVIVFRNGSPEQKSIGLRQKDELKQLLGI